MHTDDLNEWTLRASDHHGTPHDGATVTTAGMVHRSQACARGAAAWEATEAETDAMFLVGQLDDRHGIPRGRLWCDVCAVSPLVPE